MKLKPLSLIPLAAALALPVRAELLAEVYRQALENDPQLKAAEARFQADWEVVSQNRAALLPNLGLSANTAYRETDADNGLFGASDGNTHGFSISLSQPLFRAESWFQFQQAQELGEQAALRFAEAQQALILRTVQAYLGVLRARTDLITAEAQEKAVKRRLDQVSAQFDVGLIAVTDVQEAQAAYDNTRVLRIIAEGALDNSYQALKRLTGQDYRQVSPLNPNFPVQPLEPDLPQPWVDKAIQNNLALRVSTQSVEAARQASKAGGAARYPTLDLTASYSDEDSPTFEGDTRSIGLSLNMPLYQGGFISSRQRAALAELEVAVQSREDTYREVVERTRNLFRDLRTDQATIEARLQTIRSSETALEATSAGFEVGTRNVVDVLEAERQLYQARRDYADARYNYVTNVFRFKQALGTLSPEDIAELDRWMLPATQS
ncbi:TolC family outer membrane protein [Motiliproteus sp. SC1-56]|uniref:TolC family outer membrane protein n=1 Tax=Motiliproteus sp. SC1-56 TaxID=2799565 RepID=UPI001A8F16FD|nr:TolC family outer membrane protein [Motiliproteus sp. SC1-56]